MSEINKTRDLRPSDFVLFIPECETQKCQSHLKNFINALNYYQMKKPFKFSYISKNGQLILDLSLRENILLDSTDHALLDDQESKWNDVLLKHDNKDMITLMNHIHDLESTPKTARENCLKIASLVKALLNKSEYIFLESPEKHLNDIQLAIFVKALKFHAKNNSTIVFIHSENQNLWRNVANKQLLFSENRRFILRPVVQHHLKEKFLTRNAATAKSPHKYNGLQFINIDATQKKAA